VKDNGGPKPIPVRPSDSEDSRHHGSSQSEGDKESQENQTDQFTSTEAHSCIDQYQTPQHDDNNDEVMNQEDQPEVPLPGSSFIDDPKQKPSGDITTPSSSTLNGADVNGT